MIIVIVTGSTLYSLGSTLRSTLYWTECQKHVDSAQTPIWGLPVWVSCQIGEILSHHPRPQLIP